MMSIKLRVSRRCRKQELSVFLGAILSVFLNESRKSKIVSHAKPSGFKNPRFSKTGSLSCQTSIIGVVLPFSQLRIEDSEHFSSRATLRIISPARFLKALRFISD